MNLKDILANASTLLQTLLHEDSKRAVFELSCEIAAHIFNDPTDEEEPSIDTSEIEDWISAKASNDQNVVFKCTFLVDVDTCDTPCDFQTASNTCLSFSSQSFPKDNQLLVSDNDTSCEYSAVSNFYTQSPLPTEATLSPEHYFCVVVGCPVVHAETAKTKGLKFEPKKSSS